MTAPLETTPKTPWVTLDASSGGSWVTVKCTRCRAQLSFPNGYPAHRAEDAIFNFRMDHKGCQT